MGRLFATAALVALGISASFSTAQATTVGIDFGCGEPAGGDCVSGDAPLQDGYLGWAGTYGGSPGAVYDETRSFSSDFGAGGTFDLTVTSDAIYFRDYGSVDFNGLDNLLGDNILRNSPGSIVLEFSGLSAGSYSMESFHHDSQFGNNTVLFDIIVTDLAGTRTVASGLDTTGGASPNGITTALYWFTVLDGGTASITFNTATASSGNHMSINGFQLTDVAPVPLPAGVWLLLSALGGLGFAGWRRKRVETG